MTDRDLPVDDARRGRSGDRPFTQEFSGHHTLRKGR
jgi:hypothetical protein